MLVSFWLCLFIKKQKNNSYVIQTFKNELKNRIFLIWSQRADSKSYIFSKIAAKYINILIGIHHLQKAKEGVEYLYPIVIFPPVHENP